MKILGIPGSLRKGSYNRLALKAAATLLPTDTTLEVFELEGRQPLKARESERFVPRFRMAAGSNHAPSGSRCPVCQRLPHPTGAGCEITGWA